MTKHSLTTTALRIIEPTGFDRMYRISAGKFSTAVVVYLEVGNKGEADVILSANGSTQTTLFVPRGTEVQAWTDAGTAELAVLKQSQMMQQQV